MDQNEIDKIEDGILLYHKLCIREIKKSETDVVYDELQNWYRNDLLITNTTLGKHSQSKLSYYEYIWLRMVDELNKFGVRYNIIHKIKLGLINTYYGDEMIQAGMENVKKIKQVDPEVYRALVDAQDNPELLALAKDAMKEISAPLFQIILYVIHSKLDAVLVVNNEGLFDVLYKMPDERGNIEYESLYNIKDIKCSTHITIPLSQLIPQFLKVESIECCTQPNKPLSKEEYELLKMIRGKRYGVLKSITIEYKNQQATYIKVKELKKVELESRLLDHIQKGGYHNIQFTTNDGKVMHFINERSYKI